MRLVTRDDTEATIISLRMRAILSRYSPYLTLNCASSGVICPITQAKEQAPGDCYGVPVCFKATLACSEANDNHSDLVCSVGFDITKPQCGHCHHRPIKRNDVSELELEAAASAWCAVHET